MRSRAASAWLKFWGVRGSVPTPGPATVYYGGNTSCVEVRVGETIVILDAGTGLRPLGKALLKEFDGKPLQLTLLLTHTHWDHIQGLPFFQPVYETQNTLRILGREGARHGLETVLSNQMESPFFPIGWSEVPANIMIEEFRENSLKIGPVRVEVCRASHPGICVGYRLFTPNGSVTFFPDNEVRNGLSSSDAQGQPAELLTTASMIRRFIQGTDVLIMDAQYDRAEYQKHAGWGHGCVEDVVHLAADAKAKKLFLFHHDPEHDDARISKMLVRARTVARKLKSKLTVEAAREGRKVVL